MLRCYFDFLYRPNVEEGVYFNCCLCRMHTRHQSAGRQVLPAFGVHLLRPEYDFIDDFELFLFSDRIELYNWTNHILFVLDDFFSSFRPVTKCEQFWSNMYIIDKYSFAHRILLPLCVCNISRASWQTAERRRAAAAVAVVTTTSAVVVVAVWSRVAMKMMLMKMTKCSRHCQSGSAPTRALPRARHSNAHRSPSLRVWSVTCPW